MFSFYLHVYGLASAIFQNSDHATIVTPSKLSVFGLQVFARVRSILEVFSGGDRPKKVERACYRLLSCWCSASVQAIPFPCLHYQFLSGLLERGHKIGAQFYTIAIISASLPAGLE